MQRIGGARQIAEPDADLTERRERHGESVAGAVRFVQRHAALREHERLLVPVLQHRHVRLVAAHRRQDVVRLRERCHALRVAERRHRLFRASELRQRDAGQRVDERQMAAIARRVKGRRRLGDVLADDGDVADLPIAVAELVMGEADGARIVRQFGLLQRAAVERDRARLIAARRREAAMQPPQCRQAA